MLDPKHYFAAMPISIDSDVRRLSQDELGLIAYEVVGHAFDIHRELGRFFDEAIWPTAALAR